MLSSDFEDEYEPTTGKRCSRTIPVGVRLPDKPHLPASEQTQHAVMLTIHAGAMGQQMTLEWPDFGGISAGKCNFATFPKVEVLSLKSYASPSRQSTNRRKSRRWSKASRQVDAQVDAPQATGLDGLVKQSVKDAREPTSEDVHAMVIALAKQQPTALFTLRDFTGAMLLHNLLLAGAQGGDVKKDDDVRARNAAGDRAKAHKLFLELVHMNPRLLLDVHDGGLIFHGEGSLQILAVNGRSMEACEAVEKILINCMRTFRKAVADKKISPEELVSSEHARGDNRVHRDCPKSGKTFFAIEGSASIDKKAHKLMAPLLEQQADGDFFQSAPMRYFGGTPIAYFAAFGMKDLLSELVGDPKVVEANEKLAKAAGVSPLNVAIRGMPLPPERLSPLSPKERNYLVNELRCKTTQYLPIHAVAASGNTVMFDFLVDVCGANERLEVEELSALKLAVELGKAKMVKHIIRKRMTVNWKWGPVTSYAIPLDEIDTAGARVLGYDVAPERCLGNLQVLELVTAFDAKPWTKKMLLDSFMTGFVFKLIMDKWETNGWYWYLFYTAVHVIFTLQLTILAAPSIGDAQLRLPEGEHLGYRAAPVSHLVLAIAISSFMIEEELRETLSWVVVRWPRFKGKRILRGAFATLLERRAHLRLLMALLTIMASAIELTPDARNDPGLSEAGLIFFAIAVFLAWFVLMLDCFQRNEKLGVFSSMVMSMLYNDIVKKFMPLFVPILIAFTTSMHVVYPQKSNFESRWSSWWDSLENLLLFSLTGEPPDIAARVHGMGGGHPFDMFLDRLITRPGGLRSSFDGDYPPEGVESHWASAFIFFVLYLGFVLVVLLLLINLLIAMMSSSYDKGRDTATLQWRVQFSRLVLRYELLNLPLAIINPKKHEQRCMVGDHLKAKQSYETLSYDKTATLNLDRVGGDLFDDGGDDDGADGEGGGEASNKVADMTEKQLDEKLASQLKQLEKMLEKWQPTGKRQPPPEVPLPGPTVTTAAQVKLQPEWAEDRQKEQASQLFASGTLRAAEDLAHRSPQRPGLLPPLGAPANGLLANGLPAAAALPPPPVPQRGRAPSLGSDDWPSSMAGEQLMGHRPIGGAP